MSSSEIFFLIAILVITLLFLLEQFLLRSWVPFFYRYSIPLLVNSYCTPRIEEIPINDLSLEMTLNRKRPMRRIEQYRKQGIQQIELRVFNRNEIGFQSTSTSRLQASGLIRFDPDNSRIKITGHLPLAYFAAFLLGIFPIFLSNVIWLCCGFSFFAIFYIYEKWQMHQSLAKSIANTLRDDGLII